MSPNGYTENTTTSIGMKFFNLSYDDLVCLKYLLTPHGSGKRLQSQEYEQLLSDEGKMAYKAIVTRYKSLAHDEKKAYDITSVAKDRKAPSGGKSRTREADDAAIFA